MKTIRTITRSESGAVSIFVVIFAALLITVVTISFIRIMVNDQNQASSNDLSQSAYDSAQAGVEDVKRALLRYQSICNTPNNQAACAQLASDLATDECNAAVRIGNVIGSDSEGSSAGETGEIRIQQSTNTNDEVLDQAYTCTTVTLETDDYLGTLAANESAVVPLVAKAPNGSTTFDRVTVQWFSRDDLSSSTNGQVNLLAIQPGSQPLLDDAVWPVTRPPVLRVGLMQVGSSFTLENFDYTSSGESNANTLFMYPTSGAAALSQAFTARDGRKTSPTGQVPADSAGNSPLPARCVASIASGGYACQTTFTLPSPVGGGDRTAYLRLTALYNGTSFRVTMANGAQPVVFNGVQPEIDSTGRANDLFRRVVSRVNLVDTNFPLPEAALDVEGDLCKNFAVTNTAYIAGTPACTP